MTYSDDDVIIITSSPDRKLSLGEQCSSPIHVSPVKRRTPRAPITDGIEQGTNAVASGSRQGPQGRVAVQKKGKGKGRAPADGERKLPLFLDDFDSEDEVIASGSTAPLDNTNRKAGPSLQASTKTKQEAAATVEETAPRRNADDNKLVAIRSSPGPLPPNPGPIETPHITVKPVPVEEEDPMSAALVRVLEVVPDVQPTHVTELLNRFVSAMEIYDIDLAVQQVVQTLFEAPSYPKVEPKGKRKSLGADSSRDRKKVKIDYASKDRQWNGGTDYMDLAVEQLMIEFPVTPKPWIRRRLQENNNHYAPAHIALQADASAAKRPYTKKQNPYRPKGKGAMVQDPELDLEIAFIQNKQQDDAVKDDEALAEQLNEEEYETNGDGIECGCCFTDYPFNHMIQCPDAHLFCKGCMTSYVSTQLGEHNTRIVCMASSEPPCSMAFSFSELQRFMTPKLLELYHRVNARKEIELAALDNLEECPFCEYKVVMDNPEEKLFRCENVEDCGVVSCRGCKKLEHLPKKCEEADLEKYFDGQHAVDEAMSQALMRNCPKCSKAFIKESGCNKMTCPSCGTLSCYTCRQVITGYEHYADSGRLNAPGQTGRRVCLLHDAVEQRAGVEVEAAAKKALQEYREKHPDMPEEAIKIDMKNVPGTSAQGRAGPAHPPRAQGLGGLYHFERYPGAGVNVHINNYMGVPMRGQPLAPNDPLVNVYYQQLVNDAANDHRDLMEDNMRRYQAQLQEQAAQRAANAAQQAAVQAQRDALAAQARAQRRGRLAEEVLKMEAVAQERRRLRRAADEEAHAEAQAAVDRQGVGFLRGAAPRRRR